MQRPRLQFTVRRAMLPVAIVAVMTACLVGLFRSVGPKPIELAPEPRRANTDHDLFDVVLSDIVDNHELGSQGGAPGPRQFQIVCTDQSFGAHAGQLNEVLGDEIKDVPEDVRDDVLRRNPEGHRYSLARYQPSNPNILMRDLRFIFKSNLPFDSQFPNAVGYVVPSLPGYSGDGRTALFYFVFGPSGHGAAGYYLLHKVKGRWEIILKGFYAFPHDDGFIGGGRAVKRPGLKTVDQVVPADR
jgi:hypothetical protein